MAKNKQKKTAWTQYKTLDIMTYTEFFNYLESDNKVFVNEDFIINVDKPRMQTHITKSNVCTCGLSTTHFAIQLGNKQETPHINAWHFYNDLITPMLMTSDHVIPISKGGLNDISNRQVMCIKCNMKKGDLII